MAADRPKKDPQRNSALRKCFQALVDRKQVNINMDILKLMLKHELHVNIDALDEHLASVLPFMLIVYIRNWPGWQKSKEYFSGNLNFREWFLKFRQYIIVKLSFIIKNGYRDVMNEIRGDNDMQKLFKPSDLVDKGSQTDFLAPKGIAPFCISIECPPHKISSLVFSDKDDDIILNHHKEEPWVQFGLKELLNWPHIGIQFLSFGLSFKRFNRGEFRRFINLTTCPILSEKRNVIEEIKIIDTNVAQKSFSLNVLWAYTHQFFEILRGYEKVNPDIIDSLEIIMEEFIKDIRDWELNNTIALNTSVLFNIGSNTFSRNKKIGKGSKHSNIPEIGYSESYSPKVETELTFFNCVQDYTADVTFTHLNAMKKNLDEGKIDPEMQVPVIVFYCLFCETKYNSYTEVMSHLEKEHGMEPNFTCTKCLRSLSTLSLARDRWSHSCNSRN